MAITNDTGLSKMGRKPAIPQQAIVSSMVQVLVGSAGVVEIGPLADVRTGVVEV